MPCMQVLRQEKQGKITEEKRGRNKETKLLAECGCITLFARLWVVALTLSSTCLLPQQALSQPFLNMVLFVIPINF